LPSGDRKQTEHPHPFIILSPRLCCSSGVPLG